MEPITFSKNSNWYHIAYQYGRLDTQLSEDTAIDICRFRGEVIRGLLIIAAISVVAGSLVALLFADMIGWMSAMLVVGMWIAPGPATIGPIAAFATVACVILLFVCWAMVKNHIRMVGMTETIERKLPLVATAYKSWREKHCVPVKFE